MSTLARIVIVTGIKPIEGADRIELAEILGWQVVVKKNEHQVGEKCIYVNIGVKLDKENKHFAFLEGKRIKTQKIRKAISQGIIFPMSILPDFGMDPDTCKEGDDLTTILKAEKWVPDEEFSTYDTSDPDKTKVPFPQMIPKTDEDRVQNVVAQLIKLMGLLIVITQKFDGTSTTFAFIGSVFMICGRNFWLLKETISSKHYYEIAQRYDLEEKMKKMCRNLAIQGEIIGPKINGNRHKVTENEFYVFNIYDVDAQQYLTWDEIKAIANELRLKTVTCVYQGPMKEEWLDSKNLLQLADEQTYSKGVVAEGIVLKTDSRTYPSRFSCKAISNKYIIKYDL